MFNNYRATLEVTHVNGTMVAAPSIAVRMTL